MVNQATVLFQAQKSTTFSIWWPTGSSATSVWSGDFVILEVGEVGLAYSSLAELNATQFVFEALPGNTMIITNIDILMRIDLQDESGITPLGWKTFAHYEPGKMAVNYSKFTTTGSLII